MNNSLVYVHGTNGSGKSTLARAIMEHAGGRKSFKQMTPFSKTGYTTTKGGIIMLGKYANACGGVDGIQPYSDVLAMMEIFSETHAARIFAEGLVTPGLDTCKRMAELFENHMFILLDTPVEQCVTNVLKRRADSGKVNTPYNPTNLYKKDRSARLWADRLEAAGLHLMRLRYSAAFEVATRRLSPSKDQVQL